MGEQRYEVYYLGALKQGVDESKAAAQLAALFKLPLEKAERLIRANHRILKSNLNRAKADKYYSALDRLGLQVEVRAEVEEDDLDATVILDPESLEQMVQSAESGAKKQKVQEEPRPITNTPDNSRSIAVEFSGQGGEFFKIWIVNIFLSIVTLGIYSAWAKVRNTQYFYGNTTIDGASFNYTAKPMTILKGRLIAVGVFIVYSIIGQVYPPAAAVLALAFLPVIPWLVSRSLAFNARNSMYRNIRFNFTGGYGDALKTFLLWPLIIIPTFGLALPFIWYKQSCFFVNHSAYGTTPFEFHAAVKAYYRIFLIALGILLVPVAAMVAIGIATDLLVVASVAPFLFIPVYLVLFGYFNAAMGNLYFNSTTISEHQFTSALEGKKLVWIYFSNTIAIVFTLGLFIPWAQVRMTRYRAECLQLKVKGSLDRFVAAEQKSVSALGEQMGEVFDFDVSVI